LSDVAWERTAALIIGGPRQKGSAGRANRMFVEDVVSIVRTGSLWRDLPEAFGDWNSVFRASERTRSLLSGLVDIRACLRYSRDDEGLNSVWLQGLFDGGPRDAISGK